MKKIEKIHGDRFAIQKQNPLKKFLTKIQYGPEIQDGRLFQSHLHFTRLLLARLVFVIHQIARSCKTYNFLIYMCIEKTLCFLDKSFFLKKQEMLSRLLLARFSIAIHQNFCLEELYNFVIYMYIQKLLCFQDKFF
jgi:hypothetical protein